jgi:hypothetical protein
MTAIESTVTVPTDTVPTDTVPAYFVALVEIHNPAGFQSYHEQFEATLAPFGRRVVSFGATIVPWREWTGRLPERQLSYFPHFSWDGTGSIRPPTKESHRSANSRLGLGASSSKDSPCRSREEGKGTGKEGFPEERLEGIFDARLRAPDAFTGRSRCPSESARAIAVVSDCVQRSVCRTCGVTGTSGTRKRRSRSLPSLDRSGRSL